MVDKKNLPSTIVDGRSEGKEPHFPMVALLKELADWNPTSLSTREKIRKYN